MTKHTFPSFRRGAIAALMTMAFGSAWAADDELAERLKEIQDLIKPESFISVGVGNWSRDRHQQGVYDGMREGKAYGFLDLDLVKRYEDTGTWLTLTGRNLGQDTRELKAEWLRQGDIGAFIEYSRLTRDNPLTYITGLQGIGTTTQVLSGTGGNALPGREVNLGTTRDLTQLGFYKSFSRTTDLRITFSNEEKNGTRHWGLGSAAMFVVEPIDNSTKQLEAVLNFTGEKFQLSGGYYASWYDNSHSLVLAGVKTGVNGFTVSPNNANPASPTPLSLPLDNQAHQFYLNGGYSFTQTTRATFKLSYGKATQDERLPVASNVIPFASAPSSLNGRVDTTLVEVGLTSRPMPKLSLTANLRYNDVKDKTPVAQYISTGVYSTPHSITTKSGKLEGTYRLPEGFSLTGGVDYKDQNRSAPTLGTIYVPFRTAIEETTYRMQLRRGLSETLNGSLSYLHSARDGSSYVPATAGVAQQAMNPLHIADRKRDKWRGMLDWAPTDKLSIQFAVEDARDRYDFGPQANATLQGQPQGVKDGSANLYSVDASYTFNEFWQLNAWYSLDVAKMKELGYRVSGTGAGEAQKVADLKETGDSFGLGLKGQFSSKLKFGTNLELFKTVSQFDQAINVVSGAVFPTDAGVTLQPLSDIKSRIIRLKLFAEYALDKQSDLRFDVIHERWRSNDWTWTLANGTPFTYGTTTDGTTVIAKPREIATFLGARYIYKFQ